MTWTQCTHKNYRDHTVGRTEEGRLVWRCSHCGRSDVWSEGWSYHGNVECSTCWTAVIDAVACSDVCAKALQALERLTPEARAEVIEAAKRRDQP